LAIPDGGNILPVKNSLAIWGGIGIKVVHGFLDIVPHLFVSNKQKLMCGLSAKGGRLAVIMNYEAIYDWIPLFDSKHRTLEVRADPSSLASLESLPTLHDAHIESDQAYERDNRAPFSDPIEALSLTKVRIAVVLFVAVPFIIFGRRLDLYGERIGDSHHEFCWWMGYVSGVVGWLLVALLLLSLVGQWAYPYL
jgi:hypothetical protein